MKDKYTQIFAAFRIPLGSLEGSPAKANFNACRDAVFGVDLRERLSRFGVTDAQIARCVRIAQGTRLTVKSWLEDLMGIVQRGEDVDEWLRDRAKDWGITLTAS